MIIRPDAIGIDISKDHLDVFDPRGSAVRRVLNNPAQTALLAEDGKDRDCLVVMEATGPYHTALRGALDKAGVAYARRLGMTPAN